MNRKLFVGNLPFDTTKQELQALFSEVGTVEQVRLIADRETQKPRGFGFVEMVSDEDARAAIERFDQADFRGRRMVVNEAQEKDSGRPASGKRERPGGRGANRW